MALYNFWRGKVLDLRKQEIEDWFRKEIFYRRMGLKSRCLKLYLSYSFYYFKMISWHLSSLVINLIIRNLYNVLFLHDKISIF